VSISPFIFGQTYNESQLVKKWFYCSSDSAISRQQANIMVFSLIESNCKWNNDTFHWEFKKTNKFVWSDVVKYDDSPIMEGVIVVSNDTWKLVGETLFLGELEFVIDVLNEKHLIFHRVED